MHPLSSTSTGVVSVDIAAISGIAASLTTRRLWWSSHQTWALWERGIA